MMRIGKYVIEQMNDAQLYVSFNNTAGVNIRMRIESLESILEQYVGERYYVDLQDFITLFERAFVPGTLKDFGNTEEELAFLRCIPADFPEACTITNKHQRFLFYIEWFLKIFNKYRNTTFTLESVYPYVYHMKDKA